MRPEFNVFHVGQRVVYIPGHAHGNPRHEDCEHGMVSSMAPFDNAPKPTHVRVKFDQAVHKLGWDGATAQSCNPFDLQPVRGMEPSL